MAITLCMAREASTEEPANGGPVTGSSSSGACYICIPMVLVAALGANLLILAVALPLLLARGWAEASPLGGAWGVAALVALAPALLGGGLWRRSTRALLLAFPVAALLPPAIYRLPDVQ